MVAVWQHSLGGLRILHAAKELEPFRCFFSPYNKGGQLRSFAEKIFLKRKLAFRASNIFSRCAVLYLLRGWQACEDNWNQPLSVPRQFDALVVRALRCKEISAFGGAR